MLEEHEKNSVNNHVVRLRCAMRRLLFGLVVNDLDFDMLALFWFLGGFDKKEFCEYFLRCGGVDDPCRFFLRALVRSRGLFLPFLDRDLLYCIGCISSPERRDFLKFMRGFFSSLILKGEYTDSGKYYYNFRDIIDVLRGTTYYVDLTEHLRNYLISLISAFLKLYAHGRISSCIPYEIWWWVKDKGYGVFEDIFAEAIKRISNELISLNDKLSISRVLKILKIAEKYEIKTKEIYRAMYIVALGREEGPPIARLFRKDFIVEHLRGVRAALEEI